MSNQVSCVTVVLYNSQSQVLLYQRDNKLELPFPGYWSTLGGLVEADETPMAAIRRELREEIELEIAVDFWKTYERPYTPEIIIIQHVFVAPFDKPANELTLNEGQALAYFTQKEITELQIGFGFEVLIQEFFAHFSPPQIP